MFTRPVLDLQSVPGVSILLSVIAVLYNYAI